MVLLLKNGRGEGYMGCRRKVVKIYQMAIAPVHSMPRMASRFWQEAMIWSGFGK